jgi:hypothetical protein
MMSTWKPGTAPAYVLAARKIRTQREWRRIKRAEIEAAIAAVDKVRHGCAFIPGRSGEVDLAEAALERLAKKCSPKEWGR